MRRIRLGILLSATLVIAACGDQAPNGVAPRVPGGLTGVLSLCSDSSGIVSQLHSLLPALHQASAFASFDSITALLGPLPPGPDTAAAQRITLTLIGTILRAYRGGVLTGGTSSETQGQVVTLVNSLLCFAGLPPTFALANLGPDGAAAVITTTTPDTTITTGTLHAGVTVDAGSVTQTVLLTITRLPNSPGPLLTQLDQYPVFYEFSVTPQVPFTLPVLVGVCQASSISPPDPSRLRIAHNVAPYAPGSIEILPYAPAPFLDCSNVTLRSSDPLANLAMAGWRAVTSLFGPQPLLAATGGIGGTAKTFSPFGAVDTLAVMTPNSPTSQQAPTGAAVTTPPSVSVHTPQGTAITGLPVTFAVTAGGGSLTGASTTTDAAGVATVGSWILGPTAGLNSVAASAAPPQIGAGVAGSPLVFTANAVPPVVVLVNCPPPRDEDGALSRAFYLPHYPGSSLAEVDLHLSGGGRDRDGPSTVTVALTARAGSFDGPVIGTGNATVTLGREERERPLTRFVFSGTPDVTRGGKVTFELHVEGGRDRFGRRFGVGSCRIGDRACDPDCPVRAVRPEEGRGGRGVALWRVGGVTILGGR